MSSGAASAVIGHVTEKIEKIGPYVKKVIHWGFIPAIIVVGMTCTEPKPSLAQVLGPM